MLRAQSALATTPSKPIKIIVPFSVGGSADIGARRLGQLVGERLGQSVIVENRPGAGGNIGTAVAAKSQPDGYTLVYMLNTTMGVNPHAYQNTGYDPLQDFTPIIVSVKYQGILVVRADSAIRSVADLVRSAKSQPGTLSYASSGGGFPAHLMAERLNHLTGMEVLHVPYKSELSIYLS